MAKCDELSKKSIISYYDKCFRLENYIFVGAVLTKLDEKKLIGISTILLEDKLIHGVSKIGHIEDVVIDSSYRGKKLGKQLIEETINIIKKNGCYKAILECSSELLHFYESVNMINNNICMSKYF